MKKTLPLITALLLMVTSVSVLPASNLHSINEFRTKSPDASRISQRLSNLDPTTVSTKQVASFAPWSLAAKPATADEVNGSLVVITKNGTLELKQDSLQVLHEPLFGSLDNDFNYDSTNGQDDFYVIVAETADGKSTVEISVFLSPATGKYSIAYVGSAENFEVIPGVELTDVSGLIDGDLVLGNMGWEFPMTTVDTNIIMVGSSSQLSEGIWVFQGGLDQDKANQIISLFESMDELFRFQTAYLIPDNSDLGDDGGGFDISSTNYQYCSLTSSGRWRWREVLTGATVGAVVGGIVGSVIPVAGTATGAVIGGAIGGALFGGGLAYAVDREKDPDNLEDNYGLSVVSGVIGGVGGGVIGGIIGGGGLSPLDGPTGGGPTSPYAKDWRFLKIGG